MQLQSFTGQWDTTGQWDIWPFLLTHGPYCLGVDSYTSIGYISIGTWILVPK
jgi:hypothetical protein